MGFWETAESTLFTWLSNATGIPVARIIPSEATKVRPQTPYITFRWINTTPLGGLDEIAYDADLARPAGQEVRITVRAQRERVMSINIYTIADPGSADAMALADAAQASVSLPSVIDARTSAQIAIVNMSSPQNVSQLLETLYESRSAFQIHVRYVAKAQEQTGYISTATPIVGTYTT